ncbi:hypothetical protein F5Y15DRAFT_430028 [Xylariaceae sp. FL0016]|nr:hypothetical protein F5Y15DRAFT_430028 [Xylariaceae sp. FL0016]
MDATTPEVQAEALLKQYFERDEQGRFVWEGRLGEGYYSRAWKIKYQPNGRTAAQQTGSEPRISLPDEVRRIVLKTLLNDAQGGPLKFNGTPHPPGAAGAGPATGADSEEGDSQIYNEKKWLQVLKWAKHIIKMVDVPNDPLSRRFEGVPRSPWNGKMYLYLEFIENGTLARLITKASGRGVNIFPNRILWRFFLCLVRMCIAMTWPPDRPAGVNPQPVLEKSRPNDQPRGLKHDDVHNHNIMIGPFLHDSTEPEHYELTPILKLIDFGLANEIKPPVAPPDRAVAINVFEAGAIMKCLIMKQIIVEFEGTPGAETKTFEFGGLRVKTRAVDMLPDVKRPDPVPFLDRNLRDLVCICMAKDPEDRPKLDFLEDTLQEAIRARNHAWYSNGYQYCDASQESDDAIKMMMQNLVLDADLFHDPYDNSDTDSLEELLNRYT